MNFQTVILIILGDVFAIELELSTFKLCVLPQVIHDLLSIRAVHFWSAYVTSLC